jgi:ATP-binding cassette subfamily B protein
MHADPGHKLALIGATGAGKTTVTNLINRFYDLDAGSVSYDGIDIQRIRKSDLRRSLGIVLQDTALFTATVRDNIRYGRLSASDEEVEAAARLANAHEFIMSLPHGYETQLSGNSEDLSQGQRQLLSIARAALSDPPVMVLDEATSSIDTRTEALVQAGMDALMTGRTVLVIAHRLSTIVNADVIVVMDHGRVLEYGRHEQLLAQRGRYWQLYTGAFDLQ